jgi:rhodanese-related sulfurtransferase
MSLLNSLKSMFTPSPRVPAAEAAARVREGTALLVDVREPDEWRDGVADKAALLPLSDLTGSRKKWKPFLASARDREVFLYCASGMRSGRAAQILTGEGVKAVNTGGIGEWISARWPIVKPSR